jgi:hypothetical protein
VADVVLEAATQEAQIMVVDCEQGAAHANSPVPRIRKGVKPSNKRRELQPLPGRGCALDLEPAAMV